MAGLRPDPLWELTALPDTLDGFKGVLLRSGEEKGNMRHWPWGWTPLIIVTKAAENGVARPKRPRPYRTRSSANAEGPREQLSSCKMQQNDRWIALGKAYDL